MASGEGQGNGTSEVSGRGVQSAEVGGRILMAMVQAGRPLMLRELASGATITPAQAHAYLVSFRKFGLVEQDPATGRYQVGPFALQLGLARMRISNPLRLVSDAAPGLAAELGLMVSVSVWGTFGPTIVQVHEATDQVHANVRAGAVYSITGYNSYALRNCRIFHRRLQLVRVAKPPYLPSRACFSYALLVCSHPPR